MLFPAMANDRIPTALVGRKKAPRGYIVKDANGFDVAFVYEEPGRRAVAKRMTLYHALLLTIRRTSRRLASAVLSANAFSAAFTAASSPGAVTVPRYSPPRSQPGHAGQASAGQKTRCPLFDNRRQST